MHCHPLMHIPKSNILFPRKKARGRGAGEGRDGADGVEGGEAHFGATPRTMAYTWLAFDPSLEGWPVKHMSTPRVKGHLNTESSFGSGHPTPAPRILCLGNHVNGMFRLTIGLFLCLMFYLC